MANDALFNVESLISDPSTPAWLALRRFVRGPLRQVGLWVISLMVILNVAGHPSAASVLMPQDGFLKGEHAAASLHAVSAQSVRQLGAQSVPQSVSQPVPQSAPQSAPASPSAVAVSHPRRRLLSSQMTSHRLTSARLSIPPSAQAVASIAKVL